MCATVDELAERVTQAYQGPAFLPGHAIYDLGDGRLAKRCRSEEGALNERRFALRMRDEGFDVPSGYDVAVVRPIPDLPPFWFVVMERVTGVPVNKLPFEIRKGVSDRLIATIERVCDLDILPYDMHSGNALYDPSTDRLRLIDFEQWKDTTSFDEIRSYRKLLADPMFRVGYFLL